ncbi:MAG: endonuclease/exonuclease/phosphatase family protein [Clostridia bacterium]|nr:endonuclease/exonuclease/phosphatase family protein [Clostridia bacterium]
MKVSIVTFNLRMDNKHDGENYFFNRAPFILETIQAKKPDILCFQEATAKILNWLRENLTEYTVAGIGRGKDFSDEANPVAFRKDRFELFGLDQFWLSPTPHVPGSRYLVQSPCPRICVTATLRPVGEGRLIRIYNTHLDHVSKQARSNGLSSIMHRISEDAAAFKTPLLLTGDMNADPTEPCIREAIEAGLIDFTESVKTTFHDFGRLKEDCKIDYVFANKKCKLKDVEVWDYIKDGLYLSDHYPVECVVEV